VFILQDSCTTVRRSEVGTITLDWNWWFTSKGICERNNVSNTEGDDLFNANLKVLEGYRGGSRGPTAGAHLRVRPEGTCGESIGLVSPFHKGGPEDLPRKKIWKIDSKIALWSIFSFFQTILMKILTPQKFHYLHVHMYTRMKTGNSYSNIPFLLKFWNTQNSW
jgi:hypothetical protein